MAYTTIGHSTPHFDGLDMYIYSYTFNVVTISYVSFLLHGPYGLGFE